MILSHYFSIKAVNAVKRVLKQYTWVFFAQTTVQLVRNYQNKAKYTAMEVACWWAGAVMKKSTSSIWAGALKNAKSAKEANGDQLIN